MSKPYTNRSSHDEPDAFERQDARMSPGLTCAEVSAQLNAEAHARAVELVADAAIKDRSDRKLWEYVHTPKPRHEIEAEKAAKPRPDLLPPASFAALFASPRGNAIASAFESAADFMRTRDIVSMRCMLGAVVAATATALGCSVPTVLMKAGEIMGVGLRKHGPCTWRIAGTEQADPQTHYASAVRHILEHLDGVTVDPDSGKHPLLHAVCQIAIMINLLDDPPDYPDDNDGRAMIGRPR